jgi:coenzyme F420-reducing hydrogenase beta subunit
MKNCINIENKKDCCGCGACVNCCPKGAISMREDEAGFIFPEVNEELCISCGKCKRVCVFCDKEVGAAKGEPEVYAAVFRDSEILETSSSGGIFTPLANAVLDRGGAVFGAAWDDNLTLKHICVENKEALAKLRGSKYVQSSTENTFSQAKSLLDEGRYVCYCATPCQIAGLKAFLGKDYENLLTIDIICHGVPSMRMLQDDLKAVANDKYKDIKDVRFRDKRYGWAVKGAVITDDKQFKYNASTSPYYFYFLKGEIYRESCYNCRFPSENRQGDITLGDYWGIRGELIGKLGDINPDKGISCVLINTENGKKWFDEIKGSIAFAPSSREAAEKRNKQLTSSSKPLPEHGELLGGYIKNGHSAFVQGYKKHTKEHIIRAGKNMIPAKIKRKINDLLG